MYGTEITAAPMGTYGSLEYYRRILFVWRANCNTGGLPKSIGNIYLMLNATLARSLNYPPYLKG